ncbi:hypothetical protein K438DRAFT_1828198 [Mycena galopus ATCC 62051]|nr:hypothetical protein K438DRAFT_1828198 [Mycena galopus ATCC 62051]
MNSLPPELHSLIVELACASPFGGNTTRAISLTSTYFHAIATPFLFHTLALSCWQKAALLLPRLEVTPAPKRIIRRLFLGPNIGLAPALALGLIRLAAPTLRDLAAFFTGFSSQIIGAIFREPFPHLKTLAVRGFYPLPRPGAFPVLTHLHLGGHRSPAGVPGSLTRAFPKLTNLHISGLCSAPAFAREIRDVLEAQGTEPALPPHLTSLSLEAQPLNQTKRSKLVDRQDDEMRQILLALEEVAGKREGGPRVGFSEGNVGEVDSQKLKMAWLGTACP